LLTGKLTDILTYFQTKVNKKTAQNALFWAALSAIERVYHKKAPVFGHPERSLP